MKAEGKNSVLAALSKVSRQVSPQKTPAENRKNLAPKLLSLLAGLRLFQTADKKLVVVRTPVDRQNVRKVLQELAKRAVRKALRER